MVTRQGPGQSWERCVQERGKKASGSLGLSSMGNPNGTRIHRTGFWKASETQMDSPPMQTDEGETTGIV